MLQRHEGETGTKTYYREYAGSAFDLASGGMGIHTAAVELFAAGKELPYWARHSVSTSGSNYLWSPYIQVWKDPTSLFAKTSAPKSFSPHSDSHVLLLKTMANDYKSLENRQKRFFLGGERGLEISSDPASPMTREELYDYLVLARQRGIIDYTDYLKSAKEKGLIEPSAYIPPLVKNIDPDRDAIILCMHLERNGITVNDEKLMEYDAVRFDDRFRSDMVKAAIHKLGAMLAVTDQFTYEAAQQGEPIPANFQPEDPTGEWRENWEELFGKPLPTMRELYKQAHAAFIEVADKSDPLVSHLFPLEDLPQLAA